MSVAYGRGDKAKATRLHSEIIRKITGECENCCEQEYLKLTCAHIIGRRYSATRTLLANAFCLCYKCHRRFTDWPREFSRFISDTWAAEYYDYLSDLAVPTAKMDWTQRLQELKEIKQQLESGTLTLREAREMEIHGD